MSIIDSSNFFTARKSRSQYQIERSLRFNSADSAYLNRTPASAGNRKTFTISFWIKKAKTGGGTADDAVFTGNVANGFLCNFRSDSLSLYDFYAASGGFQIWSARVFRDPSAWYHIVIAIDTTQATDSNRAKIYINGVQENLATWTVGAGASRYPSLDATFDWNNTSNHKIGYADAHNYLNGYLTEFHNIDGQALTPSSFGETDTITGVWKPKKYAGTYGTNGFYLKFADNSGTTSTTLGKDSSGNSNNWTPNNFSVTAGAGNDSMIDTPTPYADGGNGRGNYCTLNPLSFGPSNADMIDGNLQFIQPTATTGNAKGTIAVSSGKWYWEVTPQTTTTANVAGGILGAAETSTSSQPGNYATGYAYLQTGEKRNNSSDTAYGASYGANDVIGTALDLDAGTLVFYKNGVSQGTAFSGLSGAFVPAIGDTSTASSSNLICNFGQRAFAYTPPSGFLALNTQNLPEPSTKKGSQYFDTKLYTGNGSSQTISVPGFSPDLVWVKNRSTANSHQLTDSVRGNTNALASDLTIAEYTGEISLNSSGFSVSGNANATNQSSQTYVAWCWDESATPGFDIVTYTGDGNAGRTVSHSLGVAPSMMIVKNRTSAGGWPVYHASFGNTGAGYLNLTLAWDYPTAAYWNNTSPTSSVFSLGTTSLVNENTKNYVAYLWSEVSGFSKFGSYTGNNSSDGPFVFCGFRPRYVLVKDTISAGYWGIFDAVRSSYNVGNQYLQAQSSSAEDSTYPQIDFLSNGFKLRANNATSAQNNLSGNTYIFAAFAESSFKYSLAR